ncbi:androgen-induced gene 1 protein-like isoform X1 [Anoplophora glabripennis]|uniref:androgen-induced gene 1 protein-like isoform X1 n=1 Tax=Anoplophora glabripennis TaxID=217634 RepID=UPI000874F3BE|nr:androgen-induced gene 1 protein-like isoform X1 [Anoplophora glabripennis]
MSVRAVCHFFATVHFWIGCYYDWNYVKVPAEVSRMGESFGFSGKLKFLTFWDALLQGFFFAICLLNDFIGTNENVPKRIPLIRKIKDLILASLAFPLANFVALTFWGLYLVDRELIFPKALDPYFPTWLNHVMHTNIAVFILIELFTSFRKYPSRKQGIGILVAFMAVYLVWIHIIHSYTGMWVYPILEVLNLPLRIVFFAVLLGFTIALYILGERLNGLVWRKQLKDLKKA